MRRPLRAMAALCVAMALIAEIAPMAQADPPTRGRIRRRVQTGRGTVPVALAIALVALTACSSQVAGSSTAPTGAPTTQAGVYEQAQAIFYKIRSEDELIKQAGGAEELPAALDRYVTGYLAEALASEDRSWKAKGLVLRSKAATVEWVRPYPRERDGSLVAIAVCGDGRDTELTRQGTPVQEGSVAINYYYFKRFDRTLKAFDVEYEVVQGCADH